MDADPDAGGHPPTSPIMRGGHTGQHVLLEIGKQLMRFEQPRARLACEIDGRMNLLEAIGRCVDRHGSGPPSLYHRHPKLERS